ncbi:ABC transporter permease [Salinicoccus albus]|uniref:ABC transporter permease n=1 Tax=Salinicoccus albus TaxID=418756 RepID=UPI0003687F94|nr:ABC transporter permease [Salinicoccus albus]
MKMAWKEMMKYKMRYIILGSIIFLISLLTLSISGLANGLSQDNAALIKNMPEGTFYMEESAEESYNFSSLSDSQINEVKNIDDNATFFSIQMGEFNDSEEQKHSLAYVSASDDQHFPAVEQGEIILDQSFAEEGLAEGDTIGNELTDEDLTVAGFVEQEKFSHSPVGFISSDDYSSMYDTDTFQLAFSTESDAAVDELSAFSNDEFLNTIPSYSAEQLSLNMIIAFLYVISGMLFAIFFYMINVQKLGTFGILKAVGVKTITLFKMMWAQMFIITVISLLLASGISELFNIFAPSGMPFHLTLDMILYSSAAFIAIGFVGATLSGIQIKKVEPMQAINQGGA